MQRKRRRRGRKTKRFVWAAAGAAILAVAAVIAGAIALLPTREPAEATAGRYAELFEHRAGRADVHAEVPPSSVLAGAAPAVPKQEVFASPLARIRITRIGVDAPIENKNITKDGVMESPSGPDVVAWYDFSAKPGLGGNAVFSGHVDYIKRGPAVFWDLRKLLDGDLIETVLQDGTVLQYEVSAVQSYPIEEIPMAEVLAPTSTESLTLITCGGSFSGGVYSHRLVLRATRTNVIKPS